MSSNHDLGTLLFCISSSLYLNQHVNLQIVSFARNAKSPPTSVIQQIIVLAPAAMRNQNILKNTVSFI